MRFTGGRAEIPSREKLLVEYWVPSFELTCIAPQEPTRHDRRLSGPTTGTPYLFLNKSMSISGIASRI